MPKPNPLGSPTAAEFRRIRDLFESALDQPVASRRAWLHIACDSDSILMQQVERMLAITDGAGHFLDGGRNDHPHAGHAACAACAAPLKATQACCVYCGTPNGALEPTSKGWFRPGTVVAGRYRIV